MKKYLLLLISLVFAMGAISQTITVHLSGRITRDSTGTPVTGNLVEIFADSNSQGYVFSAVRHSGINGYYDCTISNAPVGVLFFVVTKDCDSVPLTKHFVADTSVKVVDFVICNNAPVECHALYHFAADSTNPLNIHFWDVSTPQELVISRYWTFGDGGVSDHFDPWHLYQHAGRYYVCLTIHTSDGCTSTKCDSVTVAGNPPVNCENWITYTNDGMTYTFEGHNHSPYPTTYTWTFGDGATLTGQVVTHTYNEPGNYNVTLHTIDSVGCEWNRTITINVQTYTVYGYARMNDTLWVDHGIAELIKMNEGVVTSIDTVEVTDSLGLYIFNDVVPGHYYIRISLLPSSAWYQSYVPTYYIDAANWNYAHLIELGTPQNPYNVHMHHAPGYIHGNGNISGTITGTGGSFDGSGSPVPGVTVLLLDNTGGILAYTITSSSGEFTFPAVANGEYQIYPEATAYATTPSVVVLSDSVQNATINFAMSGGSISGVTSAGKNDFSISNIFPNPVDATAHVILNSHGKSNVEILIYDPTGKIAGKFSFNLSDGKNSLSMPVKDLPHGVYFIRFTTSDGSSTVRTMIR